MSDMDDAVREFLVESYENLDRLDTDLITLEENPRERETLASIFRTIHTIKGTCGFLGFGKLESVAHVGENLLSRLRDGKLEMNDDIATGLLQLVDAVRHMLGSIESSGAEGEDDWSALKELLSILQERDAAAAPATPAPLVRARRERDVVAASLPGAEPAPTKAAASVAASPAVAAPAKSKDEAPERAEPEGDKHGAISESNIRVDVVLLDRLMNLVGELVLARNQILQHAAQDGDSPVAATTQRLNRVTTELQEGVMKTRMQPIGNIWAKFPRVVRDLAKMCGKEVRLDMEGKDTELDKTIIEAIKDPLTHIVRNSIDHGVETPERRAAAGKDREGRILMRAFHEGGQVNIEISDDGGGIDVERVRAKIVEKGLLPPEAAARLSERECVQHIFAPGFSTAAQVTNVSGRGVGMDVVKTNIEKIGGAVDVSSERGRGTTFRIKIPLTLAIIPALLVSCGGDRYAIPQVSLLELVRVEQENLAASIETIGGVPLYRLRGNLLPLVDLGAELGVARPKLGRDGSDSAANIVVLQADGATFGMLVDEINDTEEIVVKPLGKQLKGLCCYAGATIMGDGKVALILDVAGVAVRGGVAGAKAAARGKQAESEDAAEAEKHALLLFRVGEDRRVGIPLSAVARLEEFPRSALEQGAGRRVVQYRGEILPLCSVAEALGSYETQAEDGPLQVVVYSNKGRSLGLVVERILDIVAEAYTKRPASGGALEGVAVIQGKVTDILDVEALARSLDPDHVAFGLEPAGSN
jgi:two-component system chemotaxis sensor kinase CheA